MQLSEKRPNVDTIVIGDKTVTLVGTAHVSRASVTLVEDVIQSERPDTVAVELCEPRLQSLRNPDRWKNTDIVSVIRTGRGHVLLAQILLAGFQRKLGEKLETKPGAEMMRAVQLSDELGTSLVLADRDIRTTLKRVWGRLRFWSLCKLLYTSLAGLFSDQTLSEEEVERLKSADALESALSEFSEAFPEVRETLIDERDKYLAAAIRNAPGKRIVAVIGAGHVPGIKRWIHESYPTAPLDEIPEGGKLGKAMSWVIPLAVIGMIVAGFYSSGGETSLAMAKSWFIVTGSFAAVGALLALAHPLTIASAFLASPFTTLHPLLASGWIAALVEALLRRPRVGDLETITDDITHVRVIFSNRVIRILLIMVSTNLLGTIGMIVGTKVVASYL